MAQDKNKIFKQTLIEKAKNSPETFGTAQSQYSGMESQADELVNFIEDIKMTLKKCRLYRWYGRCRRNFFIFE